MGSAVSSYDQSGQRPPAVTRDRLLAIRARHAAEPGLRDRLNFSDPEGGRQAYLEEQLAVTARLTAVMASALDEEMLIGDVVQELHHTFGVYLAVIQRLDADGILRVVAGAGPLAEGLGEFLLLEQPVDVGINGRVARTGLASLVGDTRSDLDYVIRDPTVDPLSELSVPIAVDGAIWGVLNLEEVHANAFDTGDAILMQTVAAQLGVALHRIRVYAELEDALFTMLSLLGSAMEARDSYTAMHEEAVAKLVGAVAMQFGLSPAEQRTLRYAALTHDLGKIGIPNEILHKPGALDEHEWQIMRGHTVIGSEMLARVPFFGDVHPIVRSHHERWDGDGYPDGLAGNDIPLGARILSVCDSFHAMVTARPYRSARTPPDALAEVRRCSGSQFDPAVVAALELILVSSARPAMAPGLETPDAR